MTACHLSLNTSISLLPSPQTTPLFTFFFFLYFYTLGKRERKKESEVSQSCLSLCDPMDYSLPHSSVHGIFQARILEWVAISFCRGSSGPRDRTRLSHIVGRCFTVWVTRARIQAKERRDLNKKTEKNK